METEDRSKFLIEPGTKEANERSDYMRDILIKEVKFTYELFDKVDIEFVKDVATRFLRTSENVNAMIVFLIAKESKVFRQFIVDSKLLKPTYQGEEVNIDFWDIINVLKASPKDVFNLTVDVLNIIFPFLKIDEAVYSVYCGEDALVCAADIAINTLFKLPCKSTIN